MTNFTDDDRKDDSLLPPYSQLDPAETAIDTEKPAESTVPFSERSNYHIYHSRERHYIISPEPIEDKDSHSCACKSIGRGLARAVKVLCHGRNSVAPKQDGHVPEEIPEGYYVHAPYISFHNPPRSLRRGASKRGTPICLMHNSWLWKKWRIQFGDELAAPGVIDPRGAVSWDHNHPGRGQKERAAKDQAGSGDDGLGLKGYKVRSWRLCGETGRQHHRSTNELRKTNSKRTNDNETKDPQLDLIRQPSRADEALTLTWTAPLSTQTRSYSFRVRSIDFVWKGSGTVNQLASGNRCSRFWLRYNHLKLVARIPISSSSTRDASKDAENRKATETEQFAEVCLARYWSSLPSRKAGELEIFDEALRRLLAGGVFGKEEMGRMMSASSNSSKTKAKVDVDADVDRAETNDVAAGVRGTRLYEMILATGMAMVIAEGQKRQVVKEIVRTFFGEAGGVAGTN